MILGKLGTYLNLPARVRQIRTQHRIYSAEEFRMILNRERARVNRNGHIFSLIVFDVEGLDTTFASRLAHVLARRIRSTDEVGWLDGRRVGIALPYTLQAGAGKLADDLSQLIATETSPPAYTIYTYPFEKSSGGDQHTR